MPRFKPVAIVFDLLDPIPYGLFVGALIFDAVYAKTAEVMWFKSAAWMIVIGLLAAVVPRLINLGWVWFPGGGQRVSAEIVSFVLNLLAIAAAITNAFVHSRDAYGVMPEGLWLSAITVALLVLAKVVSTMQPAKVSI